MRGYLVSAARVGGCLAVGVILLARTPLTAQAPSAGTTYKAASPTAAPAPAADKMTGALTLSGDTNLLKPMVLAGIFPKTVAPKTSFQITAELPDGRIEPLLWLQPFQPAYAHAFRYRTPLRLPKGTMIRGIPAGASVVLLPGP
mgnify:CR=1 FL=1